MANVLEQVQTYQKSNIAYLLNQFCFINQANKKFKDFNKLTANLGDTVTFDLPPRYTTADTLVATFQDSEQRKQTLTVDQAKNVGMIFTAQEDIFNLEPMDYMDEFGKSAMKQLGTTIEANVSQNAITNTFRFYGDGTTAINSFGQLAEIVAFLKEFGAAPGVIRGYLNNLSIPSIVNSGLNQFVMRRNEEMANSWELGNFEDTDWFRSNLLPIHTSGTTGNAADVLTVVSFTTGTDGGIETITFSGATTVSDPDAVKQYDLFQFQDGVSGQPDIRFRTFIGQEPCGSPVQFAASADAASDGAGNVTITLSNKLYSAAGAKQNITAAIAAGMQVVGLPSHRAGVIYSGNALYLGMPQLPEEVPFPTANKMDEDSGCSIRMYFGSKFGENQRGMVHDAIWGSTLVPEYAQRIVFPL